MAKRKRNHNKRSDMKNTYVEAYNKKDYQRDENMFMEVERSGDISKMDITSFKRLLLNDICVNSEIINTGYIWDVKLEDVREALRHPHKHWRILVAASEKLMKISPHYYRLNSLYSNMALFCWGVDLYDVKENANIATIKEQYGKLAAKLETMNLKHEFAKIMKYLPYQDIYCGLIMENTTDFFIQRIRLDSCELYQVQDGLFNFRMNLGAIKNDELEAYPSYVQKAYLDYINGNGDMWYIPPADKQICIKLNSQWLHPYPLLISIVQDILDLDVYKKLKLQSARTDNYKAIMIQVPIDESQVDKPLLTPDTLGIFAEINRANMSDDIGMIHTLGSGAEAISFKDSNNTTNNVSDAIDELYSATGQTHELYDGSSSGTAVTFSVENTSGFVYGVYRQFERWTNRYIKMRRFNKPTHKFYFYLLDMTIFNRDSVTSRYKDAVSLGATVIDKWMASIDMTPSRMLGSTITHNDIFDFYNNFKPLATSYNGATSAPSGSDKGGRPTAEERGETLSEEGEKTRDGEKNDR